MIESDTKRNCITVDRSTYPHTVTWEGDKADIVPDCMHEVACYVHHGLMPKFAVVGYDIAHRLIKIERIEG